MSGQEGREVSGGKGKVWVRGLLIELDRSLKTAVPFSNHKAPHRTESDVVP
jgi:hypothetical protein